MKKEFNSKWKEIERGDEKEKKRKKEREGRKGRDRERERERPTLPDEFVADEYLGEDATNPT